jgi:uncharacterized RmlC-like cupin family protein
MSTTSREVQVIRPHQRRTEVASGAMARFEGVSQALCGAEGIHLAIATIPPGCRSSAHWHVNCESALYVVRGRGRFVVGPQLETSLPIGPGDFIYVPPGAIHAPVNDGAEPMELVVARNAPEEVVQEYQPGHVS